MERRGQVTIFIIIAIILISSVSLFFVFKDKIGIFTQSNDPVYLFVESCIEDTGKDAIYFIIQNGGFFSSPQLSTLEGIPYYYYNDKNYVPSKERIEGQISYYIDETLSYCTNGFVDFPGFNITEGKIEARTTIKDEEVILNVKYPIAIKKGESVTRLEHFKNIRIISRIGLTHSSIDEMIQEQVGQEGICLSCLSDIADRDGLKFDMVSTEEAVIFSVKDEYSKIKGVPIEWRFANKY